MVVPNLRIASLLLLFIINVVNTSRKCKECDNCELVDERINLKTFQFPTAIKTPKGEDDPTKDAFKRFATFLLAAVNVFPQSSLVVNGLGVFTAAVAIIDNGSEDNEWKRITNMVDDKISNSETRTHFKNVRLLLKEFRVIMKKCPENLDAHDVTRLMIKKELFFPQNYPTMQFSINWVAALNAWLTCVVALYMELIKNNAISNKCALAEELAAMKGEVEEALKVLHYKRYRIVRGIDYYQGSSYNSPAALQFEDVLTGEKFPKEFKKGDNGRYLKVKIKDTYSVLFGEIRESTFDKTDSLRKRFNNLTTSLSEKFKADGCKLIDLIPVKKNKVDYPESCFGDSSSADPCLLPCDTYGTTEFFCPNGNIFGNSGNHGRLHGYNNNNPCKKNWDSCITYNETKDALLFDAGWSLIKKKKATKKLKPKTTLFKI